MPHDVFSVASQKEKETTKNAGQAKDKDIVLPKVGQPFVVKASAQLTLMETAVIKDMATTSTCLRMFLTGIALATHGDMPLLMGKVGDSSHFSDIFLHRFLTRSLPSGIIDVYLASRECQRPEFRFDSPRSALNEEHCMAIPQSKLRHPRSSLYFWPEGVAQSFSTVQVPSFGPFAKKTRS